MIRTSKANMVFKALLVGAAALGIAACGQKAKDEYKTDVTDKSGGELIVEDATPDVAGVKVPDTPMTNVPPAGDTNAPADD